MFNLTKFYSSFRRCFRANNPTGWVQGRPTWSVGSKDSGFQGCWWECPMSKLIRLTDSDSIAGEDATGIHQSHEPSPAPTVPHTGRVYLRRPGFYRLTDPNELNPKSHKPPFTRNWKQAGDTNKKVGNWPTQRPMHRRPFVNTTPDSGKGWSEGVECRTL